MKTLFTSLFLTVLSFSSYAQKWVTQHYNYDSVMNVRYGTAINFNGGTDSLYMDIFLPKCPSNNAAERPLLMWIHGGGFIDGSKDEESIQSLCKNFARRGYVTASIQYRLGYVSDDKAWSCNYPNYNCAFASDSSEWVRAYYRAVQDAKGALRYLINRHQQFKIDTLNVFVAGESAGAITALSVALMDTSIEKPIYANALSNAPNPHSSNLGCAHNQGKTFGGSSVSRPDLGNIEGTIEPSNIHYTIKGIGNMYGALYSDLLKDRAAGTSKPDIYSYHQPCDIVVPIDSNFVLWGVTWCLTNGFGCYGIANNRVKLYGSRSISNWNTSNNYGYTIQNEFTSTNFPFNYLIGKGSCVDQLTSPCHGYDNKSLRETNLAKFFANRVSTSYCDTAFTTIQSVHLQFIKIQPNPSSDRVDIVDESNELVSIDIYNSLGQKLYTEICQNATTSISITHFNNGIYNIYMRFKDGSVAQKKLLKQ